MATLGEILREVLTLTSNVGALRADVDRIAGQVDHLKEKVVRLESREDYLSEKMANTALEAVNRMTMQVYDRLHRIEGRIGLPGGGETEQLPGGADK